LPESRRVDTTDGLDQNGDLVFWTNIHAARQRDADFAALEAPLTGAFQFGSQPVARVLSVEVSPATAFLANEDYCPAHRRFGISDQPLCFTHMQVNLKCWKRRGLKTASLSTSLSRLLLKRDISDARSTDARLCDAPPGNRVLR